MGSDTDSVKNLLSRKNIHIALRYSGANDFSAGSDIQYVVKNGGVFEPLFKEYQAHAVNDPNTYYFFLLARKISKMKELVPLVADQDSAQLLKRMTDEADDAFKQGKGSAIKYINGHKDGIFGPLQFDSEIKYASLDFMIECLAGIDYSVLEYLCLNCASLIIERFDDQLLKAVSRDPEKKKTLFCSVFPSGHINAVNPLGLQAVLDIWSHEYNKRGSPFRLVIEKYADDLCGDVESLCQTMSAENVLSIEPVVQSVSRFLHAIKNPKANIFSNYVKKTEELKRHYLFNKASFIKFNLPVPSIERWKSLQDPDSKLLVLTHKLNDLKKYESYLNEEIKSSPLSDICCAGIPADNFFTPSYQQYLSILESFQTTVFREILNDPVAFGDYSALLRSAVRSVSESMSLSENELEDDLNMLLAMLASVAMDINLSKQELQVLCYGSSVFLCSFTEKILHIFYRFLVKDTVYIPSDIRLGGLLKTDNTDLVKAIGCNHVRCLAYFLIKKPETKIGRNYRNRLAHWASGMRPDGMTPMLTSCLLWLFTDVVNSVSLYFNSHANDSVPGDVAKDK